MSDQGFDVGRVDPLDETEGGAWCPTCGRPLSGLMVDGRGGCEVHGYVAADFLPRIVAWALTAANGETYAIRSTEALAEAMRPAALGYLDSAYASAHPAAGKWCNEREPFTVEPLTFEEWEERLEDGEPVLDREPSDDDIYRNQT